MKEPGPMIPAIEFEMRCGYRKAVVIASDKMGLTLDQGELFVSHFLEALANLVCQGFTVNVPGFGMFGPYPVHCRTGEVKVFPKFYSARPFSNECQLRAPHSERVQRLMERFRQNHHRFAHQATGTKNTSRLGTAAIQYRSEVSKRMRQTVKRIRVIKV